MFTGFHRQSRCSVTRPGSDWQEICQRWQTARTYLNCQLSPDCRGADQLTGQPVYWARSRRALVTTDTELRLMATAAIIGDSNMPKNGNSRPAATGTPMLL